MIIQYTGYQPEPDGRSYTFDVTNSASGVRKFTLSVENQLIAACKFKDQDMPALCYAKMKKDLDSETEDKPLPLFVRISDLELREYLDVHYPAKKKHFKA